MERKRPVACDTGPLVALFEPADQNHRACLQAARKIAAPVLTVWPVVTEALYLLRHSRIAEPLLLSQIENGYLEVAGPQIEDLPRIRELLSRYRNLPIDFADAALLALCEREKLTTVFTTDRRDFSIYRPRHVRRLTLLP